MDLNNPILSHSVDWISELAKQFDKVFVLTTHAGKFVVPHNVSVVEVGGGSVISRIVGAMRILLSLKVLAKHRKNISVLHHMTTKPLALIGPVIKLMRIPQALWFSHAQTDIFLNIGARFADLIFTPTPTTFPLKEYIQKIVAIGHGINLQNKECSNSDLQTFPTLLLGERKRFRIAVLGRVSPIKNLEVLIHDLTSCKEITKEIELRIIGPIYDYHYWDSIKIMAKSKNLNITYVGILQGAALRSELLTANFVFNGMFNSLDKSAIVAGINGCFLVSCNSELMEIFYKDIAIDLKFSMNNLGLDEQIKALLSLPEVEVEKLRLLYVESLRNRFDLRRLIQAISTALKERMT